MLGLALLTLFAHGRESTLPEPSEPPYEVGARPLESGHIIERKGAPDLNFRIVENRMRLYWLDEDGLVMEPEVLLLDEPTSSLDDSAGRVIEDLILSLKEKLTILVVSHYLEQVKRLADKSIRFSEGSVIN